ncbi:hypothetical protein [Actinomadura xylanilytica]|uniref:hypothetical protein n=1 Tax=Actinomadura xylanilytica TaxID=887459 RepID=UPI00255AFA43|nr:hypothetical protein [Actinomadura xylanilytica]MDL4772718.1 hypothetical protein [Actinomadura xylanilytica]
MEREPDIPRRPDEYGGHGTGGPGTGPFDRPPDRSGAPYGTGAAPSPSTTTGPIGVRETSGVEVRLGSRSSRNRERRERERAGRRNGLIAAGVLGLAAAVAGGLLLLPASGDDNAGGAPVSAQTGAPAGRAAGAPLPRRGKPVVVGTADGSKYRIEAVTGGTGGGVTAPQSSAQSSGAAGAYVEYVLSNPSDRQVLLDFPGDVFLKRSLVSARARGRCMPQAGVPEDMCTPPIKSDVVRRLAGAALVSGDGGDKFMPPGASYLVRATVAVPVDKQVARRDLHLYVWKQLYMADHLAKEAPFPR